MRKEDKITRNIDWPLFACYLVLVTMGLMTVYSTAYDPEHPMLYDMSKMYGKQLMWVGVSLFLGLLVFLIDSSIYRKFAVPIYLFTLSLLVLVLFMPAINGAHAWLGFGSFGIQPAEFAKFATTIALAAFLSTYNTNIRTLRHQLIAFGLFLFSGVG